MPKKKLADSIVALGEVLGRVPFGAVVTFVSAFSLVLLAQIISELTSVGWEIYAVITVAFILGTGIVAVLIQIGAIGTGRLLIWIGTRRVRKTKAKLEFSVRRSEDDFYLVIHNAERWFKAKNVYIYWQEFAVSPEVSNTVVRQYLEWNKNTGILQWVKDKSTKKNNAIDIGRKKSKEAYLFRLHKDRDEFSIIAVDHDPFYFPVGGYRFNFVVHINIPRRLIWSGMYVSLEFKPYGQMEIDAVQEKD